MGKSAGTYFPFVPPPAHAVNTHTRTLRHVRSVNARTCARLSRILEREQKPLQASSWDARHVVSFVVVVTHVRRRRERGSCPVEKLYETFPELVEGLLRTPRSLSVNVVGVDEVAWRDYEGAGGFLKTVIFLSHPASVLRPPWPS